MSGSKLRTPALVIACIAAVLVVLVEMGGGLRAQGSLWDSLGSLGDQLTSAWESMGEGSQDTHNKVDGFRGLEGLMKTDKGDPPGYAIAALAILDGLLVFSVVLMTIPLVVNKRLVAQTQGIATVIMSILTLIWAFLLLLQCLVMVFVMIGMLLALPFGTILYMILYADFDTSEASAILSTVFLLKAVCGVCLVIAHEKFLKNIGFMLMLATCFLGGIIVSFLHNLVPSFIVSITDSVAAIIVCILAIIWAIVFLVGGIISVVKVILSLDKLVE